MREGLLIYIYEVYILKKIESCIYKEIGTLQRVQQDIYNVFGPGGAYSGFRSSIGGAGEGGFAFPA